MESWVNKIHHGNILDVLRRMPEASVHTVVTSPPYWGLREYEGVVAQVWGGLPECAHAWTVKFDFEDEIHHRKRHWQNAFNGAGRKDSNPSRRDRRRISQGEMCSKCRAWKGHLGIEPLHDCNAWARWEAPCSVCFVCHMRTVFAEVRRVMRPDATLWINLRDCYASDWACRVRKTHHMFEAHRPSERVSRMGGALKHKDLVGIPWRVGLALQADGFWLRNDDLWIKINTVPESPQDRCTLGHEYILMLAIARKYFWDFDAVMERQSDEERNRRLREQSRDLDTVYKLKRDSETLLPPPGKNGALRNVKARYVLAMEGRRRRRTAWILPSSPYAGDHPATFPEELARICILAGTSEKGVCPKCGAPWRPIFKKKKVYGNWNPGPGSNDTMKPNAMKPEFKHNDEYAPPEKVGWKPHCKCGWEGPLDRPIVLDPFMGSGTTALAALRLNRRFVGIDLSQKYIEEAERRIQAEMSQPKLV